MGPTCVWKKMSVVFCGQWNPKDCAWEDLNILQQVCVCVWWLWLWLCAFLCVYIYIVIICYYSIYIPSNFPTSWEINNSLIIMAQIWPHHGRSWDTLILFFFTLDHWFDLVCTYPMYDKWQKIELHQTIPFTFTKATQIWIWKAMKLTTADQILLIFADIA